ncbi:MAG: hypothetical protein H0X67_00875 [Acidobacteria bacterium]|nr:hypothetical protein [Acidobacteriota bacterium]
MVTTAPFEITASPALLAAGAVMAGVLLAACAPRDDPAPPAPAIEVGRPFPAVRLPDAADGRPRSIAEFRGRKVLLHVFASW